MIAYQSEADIGAGYARLDIDGCSSFQLAYRMHEVFIVMFQKPNEKRESSSIV